VGGRVCLLESIFGQFSSFAIIASEHTGLDEMAVLVHNQWVVLCAPGKSTTERHGGSCLGGSCFRVTADASFIHPHISAIICVLSRALPSADRRIPLKERGRPKDRSQAECPLINLLLRSTIELWKGVVVNASQLNAPHRRLLCIPTNPHLTMPTAGKSPPLELCLPFLFCFFPSAPGAFSSFPCVALPLERRACASTSALGARGANQPFVIQ
jgi:hypothetical protein